MEEVFEGKVLESIDLLTSYVGQTADFVSEQAPLLVTEIVRWGIVSNLFEVIVGVLMGFATLKLVRWIHDPEKNFNEDRELAYFVAVPTGIIGFLLFVFAVLSGIKAVASPRLYVLERLTSMAVGS